MLKIARCVPIVIDSNANHAVRAFYAQWGAPTSYGTCCIPLKTTSLKYISVLQKQRVNMNPMENEFEGRCQCGMVEYRICGEAATLFACHCSECQRQSASAFGMALWIRDYEKEIVKGRLKSWIRNMPDGRKMLCEFCAECGSRIFHQMLEQPQVISIKPGTLNNSKTLRPVAHIWVNNAQPWVLFEEGCLLYPEDPPDFEDMFLAWSKSNPVMEKHQD